ncbi:hypothetical protein Pmani_005153 [Petrolisthes manimaculis]|uniref:Uncharacterized protein n=1 Tax=Petrolisthes manimaculis TaxID=1843537 RepID=A0AAE1QC67_9EUCA|nr:hypothetical protein Pmani_005148 [Petrolisthes manimaculis]KAK4324150.1 hypothetical protein Pmani_005153 [Petrolisthes manimaculis]
MEGGVSCQFMGEAGADGGGGVVGHDGTGHEGKDTTFIYPGGTDQLGGVAAGVGQQGGQEGCQGLVVLGGGGRVAMVM